MRPIGGAGASCLAVKHARNVRPKAAAPGSHTRYSIGNGVGQPDALPVDWASEVTKPGRDALD